MYGKIKGVNNAFFFREFRELWSYTYGFFVNIFIILLTFSASYANSGRIHYELFEFTLFISRKHRFFDIIFVWAGESVLILSKTLWERKNPKRTNSDGFLTFFSDGGYFRMRRNRQCGMKQGLTGYKPAVKRAVWEGRCLLCPNGHNKSGEEIKT